MSESFIVSRKSTRTKISGLGGIMRGIQIKTRSGKRTICMCHKCYERENDEIELALEFGLIVKPIVTDIEYCELHFAEKENGRAFRRAYEKKLHRGPGRGDRGQNGGTA